MSGTWELFALKPNHLPPKHAWKVECPLSKWKVNSVQSTLYTKHNLKKKTLQPPLLTPPTRREKKKGGCHFTPQHTAWKFYFLKLGAAILHLLWIHFESCWHGSFFMFCKKNISYCAFYRFYYYTRQNLNLAPFLSKNKYQLTTHFQALKQSNIFFGI